MKELAETAALWSIVGLVGVMALGLFVVIVLSTIDWARKDGSRMTSYKNL